MKLYPPIKDPSIPDPRDTSLTLAAIIEIFDIESDSEAHEALEHAFLDF